MNKLLRFKIAISYFVQKFELSMKYQSYPKSSKIGGFGQEICFCHTAINNCQHMTFIVQKWIQIEFHLNSDKFFSLPRHRQTVAQWFLTLPLVPAGTCSASPLCLPCCSSWASSSSRSRPGGSWAKTGTHNSMQLLLTRSSDWFVQSLGVPSPALFYLSCAWVGLVLVPQMCFCFVLLAFFPSASWPLSFLSLFFLFLRPCLIHARMPDWGRAFVHGHTFLHSWN